MNSKTRGNKIIGLRADRDLHAKLGRITAATGADKSAIVRSALGFLTEEQIAGILAQRGQQQSVAVQHAA